MLSDDLIPGAKGAAAYIGVPPKAVYNLVAAGHLRVIRKGRKLYFRKSELEADFRSQSNA